MADPTPPGEWQSILVEGTLTVIPGLANGLPYEVRVRSVDTSGNTLKDTGTTDVDGNPIFVTVKAGDDPDAGWVVAEPVTPSALPGNALVWSEAIIGDVFADSLSADWLRAGTLTVGGAPGQVAAIKVVDAEGETLGTWSDAGIVVRDPDNPDYRLLISESSLLISDVSDADNPIPIVTMNPLGIDAASITFGSARGGHNLVQNSSFEMGGFPITGGTSSNLWDLLADFNTSRVGADANLTTGATIISMTAVT